MKQFYPLENLQKNIKIQSVSGALTEFTRKLWHSAPNYVILLIFWNAKGITFAMQQNKSKSDKSQGLSELIVIFRQKSKKLPAKISVWNLQEFQHR